MTVEEAKTKTCHDKMIIVAGLGIGGKNRVGDIEMLEV